MKYWIAGLICLSVMVGCSPKQEELPDHSPDYKPVYFPWCMEEGYPEPCQERYNTLYPLNPHKPENYDKIINKKDLRERLWILQISGDKIVRNDKETIIEIIKFRDPNHLHNMRVLEALVVKEHEVEIIPREIILK